MADLATTAAQATNPELPGKMTQYTNSLYEALLKNLPQINYAPRGEAQLRDNLESAYRASYDQSVKNRRLATQQNRSAIDSDAASRGLGASTWVTDAKMRQNDREASDLATMAAQKRSTISQALANAMAEQEANSLAAQQYNGSMRANALSSALSTVGSMYDKLKAEDPTNVVASGGGGGGSSSGSSRSGSPDTDPGTVPDDFNLGSTGTTYSLANTTNSGTSQYTPTAYKEEADRRAEEKVKKATYDPKRALADYAAQSTNPNIAIYKGKSVRL